MLHKLFDACAGSLEFNLLFIAINPRIYMDRFLVPLEQPIVSSHDASPATHIGTPETVASFDDLFTWPHANFIATARHGIVEPAHMLHDGMAHTKSLTSSFNGVCAETVASNMLHAYLQRNGFPDMPKFEHLASVEKDNECRLEQQVLPHGPTCEFGNILDFCTDATKKQLDAHMVKGTCELGVLAPLFLAPGAIKTTAYCNVHKRHCPFPRATGHSAGCPCTDFTTWGAQRRLTGPPVPVYLVWLAMRLLLCEFWILSENVPLFPTALLECYLQHLYHLSEVFVPFVYSPCSITCV